MSGPFPEPIARHYASVESDIGVDSLDEKLILVGKPFRNRLGTTGGVYDEFGDQ